ncbi:PREDICTED: 21 kDa protein-like [Tarenaya hassleriana]|uniref:21 kDa protein-like n=1 Tax=Tarenaya hassleriana TaxID=28532 RepID=UPI00053C6D80|nr:PREDICTED: 21 kDa protein-like [Tarenaya hassleriana]XP_010521000.1 PREDICTED: 21 kDa protein-like [Tarenaya hassleriana]
MSSLITITILFSLLIVQPNPSLASKRNRSYVRNACSATLYKELCVRSLTPFSALAKNSPSKWARAGVAVTITDTKHALRRIVETRRSAVVGKRDGLALSDCRELFQDALDELHRSLGVLRTLNSTASQTQISDMTTWVSTALTDQDTCLDGFEGSSSSTAKIIRRRVTIAMYFTSNALALVNKLAAAGV